jgi:nucleoside-triphosphatase THEP1
VRERGQRVGSEIVGLGGRRCLLAHVGWHSQLRFGRHGVEPARPEPILLAELGQPPGEVVIYVLDEIGKMECLYPSFVEAMRGVLEGTGVNSPATHASTIRRRALAGLYAAATGTLVSSTTRAPVMG